MDSLHSLCVSLWLRNLLITAIILMLVPIIVNIDVVSAKKRRRNKKYRDIPPEVLNDYFYRLEEQTVLIEKQIQFDDILMTVGQIMVTAKWNDVSVFMEYLQDNWPSINMLAVAVEYPETEAETPIRYYTNDPCKYMAYFVVDQNDGKHYLDTFWGLLFEFNQAFLVENYSAEELQALVSFDPDANQDILLELQKRNVEKLKDAGYVRILPREKTDTDTDTETDTDTDADNGKTDL